MLFFNNQNEGALEPQSRAALRLGKGIHKWSIELLGVLERWKVLNKLIGSMAKGQEKSELPVAKSRTVCYKINNEC